ncbi:5-hydroxytryptamine receptor 3A-like [Lampris incognitus]|uniref:5-hydroxytryptamine receptor 3A-like n=1 Tax=Lampris incognitus TaxID=2546036 RepID=UPI0024B5F2AA|nr:5-hydroxytryptamine receptor 3A-like [Lampris incognitus]
MAVTRLYPSHARFRVMLYISMPAPCSSIMLNCSRPNPPALLEALAPVLKLQSIRPVMNITTYTNVRIYFILYGILGVDEKAQLLTTYIWLNFEWQNEFVHWDPIQCGAKMISLPRASFWVPDVVINEFMDDNTAPNVPYVYLTHDGHVRDAQPVRVVSSCNLNIYTFPFDIQNCTFTFNSYIHSVKDVRMSLGKPVEDILAYSRKVMTTMGEWQLLDITYHKYIMSEKDKFVIDELAFHITLRRRATLYVVNLLIPSCFLITLDLFSFLLPPQCVDRSSIKMTLILGYTVFLLIMNDLLPITGNSIPLINVFFSLCLALMVASLLETILITNLLCGPRKLSAVPRWVQVIILQTLGCLVGLPPKLEEQRNTETKVFPVVAVQGESGEKPSEEKGSEEVDMTLEELRKLGKDLQAIRLQMDKPLTDNQMSEEWIQVGFVLDRLLFVLYILFVSISFITIICVWAQSYDTI